MTDSSQGGWHCGAVLEDGIVKADMGRDGIKTLDSEMTDPDGLGSKSPARSAVDSCPGLD